MSKEVEAKKWDIAEETKADIDWILEDLHHIKKAREDSKYFCGDN